MVIGWKRAFRGPKSFPRSSRHTLEELRDRLASRSAAGDFDIRIEKRLHRGRITEGIAMWNLWVDIFEPVRAWSVIQGRWEWIQDLDEVERNFVDFMKNRPDLK